MCETKTYTKWMSHGMVVMVVVVVEYLKMSIKTSIADAVRRDRSEMRKSIGENQTNANRVE